MKYAMEYTGERYLPWSGDYLTGYEHIHRYLFARAFVRGKRVLDVACGEGYGTAMLADAAALVLGVDIDATAVAHAREVYGRSHVHFVRADAQRLGLRAGGFDVAVSFETIEHFVDHDAFLDSVKAALRPDGLLVISSPNRDVYADGYQNPFHRRELDEQEFMSVLRRRFRHVSLLGQRLAMTSVMTSVTNGYMLRDERSARFLTTDIAADVETFSGEVVHAGHPRYYIAVCADEPLPTPPNTVMIDEREILFRTFMTWPGKYKTLQGELEKRVAEQTGHIGELTAAGDAPPAPVQIPTDLPRHRATVAEERSARAGAGTSEILSPLPYVALPESKEISPENLAIGPSDPIQGFHEGTAGDRITGWVWDRTRPDVPLEVEIYAEGVFLATVRADLFRADLHEAGKGDGKHGFRYSPPLHLRDGHPHVITIRVAGTSIILWNTSQVLQSMLSNDN